MRVDKKLQEWVSAGLLSSELADAILTYEQKRKRPTLLLAFAGLGALAVAIGIVSVVAANWDKVSPPLKLAADLVWGVVLAAAIYSTERLQRNIAREVLIVIFWGYVLASISLIAQIYNLASEPYRGLLAWSLVTTPIMLVARSKFSALLFVSGWCVTFGWMAEPLTKNELGLIVYPSLPFLALLVGKWLEQARSYANFSWALRVSGWGGIVLGSSGMQLAWYFSEHSHMGEAALGIAVTASLAVLLAYLYYPTTRLQVLYGGFFGTAIVLAFAPFLAGANADLLAALSFLILWGWIAYLAHTTSQVWIYNLAIGALAVRILVIYFEVFGSLLSTGIGLILGGILTLFLGWLYSRWSIRSSNRGGMLRSAITKRNDS